MLQRLDRFLGRWVHRGFGLVAGTLGGLAVYGGYQILAVHREWVGLFLLIPGAVAAAYGVWLIVTANRRRLTDVEF